MMYANPTRTEIAQHLISDLNKVNSKLHLGLSQSTISDIVAEQSLQALNARDCLKEDYASGLLFLEPSKVTTAAGDTVFICAGAEVDLCDRTAAVVLHISYNVPIMSMGTSAGTKPHAITY